MADPKSYRLRELDDLVQAIKDNRQQFNDALHGSPLSIGDLYCTPCGGQRRMQFTLLFVEGVTYRNILPPASSEPDAIHKYLVSSLFRLRCGQCHALSTMVVYQGTDGPRLVVLQGFRGGLASPNTPTPVRYYLDQADRCRSVGATSAAVAMYRAGLEHFLFEQGFRDGMLNQKLTDLQKAVDAGKAPRWASDLDAEYLHVIKDLGNGAVHTNGGDIGKQEALDDDLLAAVEVTFEALLYLAYEVPVQKAKGLGILRGRASLLKK